MTRRAAIAPDHDDKKTHPTFDRLGTDGRKDERASENSWRHVGKRAVVNCTYQRLFRKLFRISFEFRKKSRVKSPEWFFLFIHCPCVFTNTHRVIDG